MEEKKEPTKNSMEEKSEVVEEKAEEKKSSKMKKKRKTKKRTRLRLWVILFFLVLDLGASFCLVLAYGPNKNFRDWLVTTAMSTMNHKYLARMIYNEETINQVLKENTVIEINEETDTDAIVIGSYETDHYESEYEEQILKKEEGNDVYKIVTFKENGSTYYITVIYDPSRIHLAIASRPGVIGDRVKKLATDNDAKIAINASGFEDAGGGGNGANAAGVVIHDGKIVWQAPASKWGNGLIGFNQEHKLVLTKESASKAIQNGMVDAVTFGPFLIVNGKSAEIKGYGGGVHPRTIIAQRKDGIVLFVVIDGNGNKTGYRGGVSLKEAIEVLERYKVYNAANLDGGASSILVENGEIVNHPVGYSETGERWHPNAWIVQ